MIGAVRRPPCEGVGRNCTGRIYHRWNCVALHVRAWVEMAVHDRHARQRPGRPPCEGVGRNADLVLIAQ